MSPGAVSVIRVPLRWVDLDAQAHVNNALVVDYLQEARVDFLLNGPNAHLLGAGVIVVGHQVEYRASIDFDADPLEVHLRVGPVGASRFTLDYELFQHGALVARARTHLCVFDFDLGRPVRLKPDERAWFAQRSHELEPFRHLGSWRPGEAAYEYPLAVRWSDVDSYGHVNNTRFFDYVAEARIAMNNSLLPGSVRTGIGSQPEHLWMVARQDMDYLGQMAHRLEPYVVRTSVADMGRTSMTKVAEIVDPLSGKVSARSTTVVVYAGADGRPEPIPPVIREGLAQWPARQHQTRSA